MIRADVAHTRPLGFFATLKLLFSSSASAPGAGTRVRRAMTEAERQTVLLVRNRALALFDGGHEAYADDTQLALYADRQLMGPLRDLLGNVAAEWGEPQLGRLANILRDFDASVWGFYEKRISRSDFLGGMYGLDELEHNLRVLARS